MNQTEPNREKHITPLAAKDPPKEGKLRVAAYCRVSTDRPEQEGSLENQQNFFRKRFESSEREELVGIYADRGFSGTRADLRPELQHLMADCRKGLIDRIVCKSISRFARNLRDCLLALRELKALGITIFFEKENLDTAVISDEIMLTVMESGSGGIRLHQPEYPLEPSKADAERDTEGRPGALRLPEGSKRQPYYR